MVLNPLALRAAKTLWSFGHSECKRVKVIYHHIFLFYEGRQLCDFLFASLDDINSKMGFLIIKERILSQEQNLKSDLHSESIKNKYVRITSPEMYPSTSVTHSVTS